MCSREISAQNAAKIGHFDVVTKESYDKKPPTASEDRRQQVIDNASQDSFATGEGMVKRIRHRHAASEVVFEDLR
jgi:hypothetical protein